MDPNKGANQKSSYLLLLLNAWVGDFTGTREKQSPNFGDLMTKKRVSIPTPLVPDVSETKRA
jgi:hypothetical protein